MQPNKLDLLRDIPYEAVQIEEDVFKNFRQLPLEMYEEVKEYARALADFDFKIWQAFATGKRYVQLNIYGKEENYKIINSRTDTSYAYVISQSAKTVYIFSTRGLREEYRDVLVNEIMMKMKGLKSDDQS